LFLNIEAQNTVFDDVSK